MNAAAEKALRALQKLDDVASLGVHRDFLVEAESALGDLLGLECTGYREGPNQYDHSGDTCPIHEWLVPADYDELHPEEVAA